MQPSDESDSNSTPVFVPRKVQRSSNPHHNNGALKDREITLNAASLSNGILPKRTSTVLPAQDTSISVKAEIHKTSLPNGIIKETPVLKSASNVIKSILKSKHQQNSFNNSNYTVPNGVNKTLNTVSDGILRQEIHNQLNTHNQANDESIIDNSIPIPIVHTDVPPMLSKLNDSSVKSNSKVKINMNPVFISRPPSVGRLSIASPSNNFDNFPRVSSKISDLRRILNPEEEKEDVLKHLGESIMYCECFELNLNNAAKIITLLVLLATFILVIKALTKES